MNQWIRIPPRAAATLRRLRYSRVSMQWCPVARIDAGVPDAVHWVAPVRMAPDRLQLPAIFCHPPSSLTYRLEARPGDSFVAASALMPEMWNRNLGGVDFTITIRAADGSVLREASRRVDPGTRPRDRRWCFLRVPIPVRTPQEVTITLGTRVPPWYAGDNAWAIWGDPLIERRRPILERRALLRAVIQRARKGGIRAALRAVGLASRLDERTPEYRAWVTLTARSEDDQKQMAEQVASMPRQPLVSILTPVYNTPADHLRACANSVLGQIYSRWEWCVCDDGSTSAETKAVLRELTDGRIRVITLENNAGIAAASQAALAAATGEFVVLLDHDDELTPDALCEVVCRLNDSPEADVLYADEDKLDADGGVSEPFFKPDWSPEYLLSTMYTCHPLVARRQLVGDAGGFRPGFDGAQDHDLMLRIMERAGRIEHIPRVLYHWRRTASSTATHPGLKSWADKAGLRAVEDYVRRNRLDAEALPTSVPGLYRVRFRVAPDKGVLIVIVGEDDSARERCAERIRAHTAYPSYELVCASPVVLEINTLVRERGGSNHFVAFIDSSLVALESDWLDALLEYAQQPAIGAAGGKVCYPDKRLRHVGLVLGADGGVGRVLHGHLNTYGYFANTIGVRNWSAVSGECLVTRREVFERLGGFDETLPWSVADVDYCVRATRDGARIVFTPYARLQIHAGEDPVELPDTEALASLRERWGTRLQVDPFYSRNFNRAGVDYQFQSQRVDVTVH